MTKKQKQKQLMSSAPWRGEDTEDFADAKLKVTSDPGTTPTMHVPRKRSEQSNLNDDEDDSFEIDPELRYSFQRNFQVNPWPIFSFSVFSFPFFY